MNNKNKKRLKKILENYYISIKSFLICYCGVCDQNLLNSKVTHDDIKVVMPYLERKSFDYVLKNIREINVGNILLVNDSLGNVIPYVKPNLNDINYDIQICYEKNIEESNNFEQNIDIEKLNKYELIQLRKKYKEQGKIPQYRKVCRMIEEKKEKGLKEYHKNKEKIKLKGRLENDQY